MICQVADSGQNGVFGSTGTVLLGEAYVKSNGSVSYIGTAASFNGIYTFEFASRDTKTFNKVRPVVSPFGAGSMADQESITCSMRVSSTSYTLSILH